MLFEWWFHLRLNLSVCVNVCLVRFDIEFWFSYMQFEIMRLKTVAFETIVPSGMETSDSLLSLANEFSHHKILFMYSVTPARGLPLAYRNPFPIHYCNIDRFGSRSNRRKFLSVGKFTFWNFLSDLHLNSTPNLNLMPGLNEDPFHEHDTTQKKENTINNNCWKEKTAVPPWNVCVCVCGGCVPYRRSHAWETHRKGISCYIRP